MQKGGTSQKRTVLFQFHFFRKPNNWQLGNTTIEDLRYVCLWLDIVHYTCKWDCTYSRKKISNIKRIMANCIQNRLFQMANDLETTVRCRDNTSELDWQMALNDICFDSRFVSQWGISKSLFPVRRCKREKNWRRTEKCFYGSFLNWERGPFLPNTLFLLVYLCCNVGEREKPSSVTNDWKREEPLSLVNIFVVTQSSW